MSFLFPVKRARAQESGHGRQGGRRPEGREVDKVSDWINKAVFAVNAQTHYKLLTIH